MAMPGPFSTDRRNALLKHLVSPRSAPVANLQHETAATNARRGGSYCAYSRLARHEWRSTRPAPPLCKQGVRGSSPLGSTPSESTFGPCLAAVLFGRYSRKYSNGHHLLTL